MPDLSSIGRSRDVFKPVNSFGIIQRTMGSWAEQAKKNLDEKGKNASYALRQSIRIETKIMGKRVVFSFIMEDYWEWVDKGRGPGKHPPPDKMLEWVTTKSAFKSKAGLSASSKSLQSRTKSLAFLVGRKIAQEGTKGSNFYSDVVNEKSLNKLQEMINKELKRDVDVSIKAITDDFNKNNQISL